MSILVTGGAGFIGSNLTEDLFGVGRRGGFLDNMHTGSKTNLDDLDDVEGSSSKLQPNSRLDLNPEEIYHLGIPSSSPMYKKDPFLVGEAINGTTAIFELARRTGARVIYASSSSLYNGLLPPHRVRIWSLG